MAKLFNINVEVTDDVVIDEQLPQLASNILSLSGKELEGLLTDNSPYDTCHLQRSWRTTQGSTKVTIVNSAEYAHWVNDGRGSVHVKNAKALKFTKGGKVVGFAKSAKATRGKKFVEKSIRELEGKIPNIVAQALSKL